MKISYRVKLIISIFLLVILSQFLTGHFIIKQTEEFLEENHHHMGNVIALNVAQFAAEAILSRDLASLYEHIKLTMGQKNVRHIKIVGPDNRVIVSDILTEVDSRYPPKALQEKYQETEKHNTVHFISNNNENIGDITVPIIVGRDYLGQVVVGYSHVEISQDITRLKKKAIFTLAVGLAGSCLIAILLIAMITKPLQQLRQNASLIASGKFDINKPDLPARDEFSFLANTTFDMAKRIEGLVYNDPLTGVYNRQLLNIRLREELARSRRHKWPLALLLVDIDHFKKINDTYGHMVGDEMLIAATNMLSQHIREIDCLARFGGEEFVILAPNMTEDNARLLAERIRHAIDQEHFISTAGRQAIRMTISVGLAIFPENAADENALITNADNALYKAKSSGRNKVVTFSSILT